MGRAGERKEEDATGGDRGQADRDVCGGKLGGSVGGVLGVRVCVCDVGGEGFEAVGAKGMCAVEAYSREGLGMGCWGRNRWCRVPRRHECLWRRVRLFQMWCAQRWVEVG